MQLHCTDEIENYEPAELNTLLEHFYAEDEQ